MLCLHISCMSQAHIHYASSKSQPLTRLRLPSASHLSTTRSSLHTYSTLHAGILKLFPRNTSSTLAFPRKTMHKALQIALVSYGYCLFLYCSVCFIFYRIYFAIYRTHRISSSILVMVVSLFLCIFLVVWLFAPCLRICLGLCLL